MPDFAKALRGLKPPRKIGAEAAPTSPASYDAQLFSLREQLQFLKSGQIRMACTTLPEGEIHSNHLGSHYVMHSVYPEDYFHGRVRLSRFCSAELSSLMMLVRAKGTVPPRDRIVFLDTETTGIQGGTGICPFLVGIGFFVDSEFHMIQYFIRDFDEEPSMLLALAERLNRFELAVTYNGAAFDIPLLETRFTLARMDSPFREMSHFDLLFTARKLWRNGHGSCRLVALENELISFFRGPDIPGAMIPRAYFDYLQRRPAPALQAVFTHNCQDVISLAALTVHAADRVNFEPAALDEPLDLFSLARMLESSADWQRAIRLYEMALDGGLPDEFHTKALENVAILYRRAGQHERSLAVCKQLLRCSEFSMVGHEGAAIYYERVAQNYEAAVSVLEAGLVRATKNRWKRILQMRWDRLQQKRLEFEAIRQQ